LAAHFSPETINQGCVLLGNMTALHFATAFHNGPLILDLLKLGGKIWKKDDNGNSPYDLARIVHGEHSQCFQILHEAVKLETWKALGMNGIQISEIILYIL